MIPQQLQDTSRRNGQFRAIIHRGPPGVIPVRNLLLVLATLAGERVKVSKKGFVRLVRLVEDILVGAEDANQLLALYVNQSGSEPLEPNGEMGT